MKNRTNRFSIFTIFLVVMLTIIPSNAKAFGNGNMGGDMGGMMSGMFNSMNTNSHNSQNFAMDSMMQEFMNNLMNQNQNQNQDKSKKVSASGFLAKEGDKYYIGEDKEKHQIITKKEDMLIVMPILAGKEVPVEFIGEYDAKKQIVYAERMNLLKRPSNELLEEIDEALEEFQKKQPISGRGYIVTNEDEDGYLFKVKEKVYELIPESSDIEVVLPLVADDDELLVELIGHLNEEKETFKAERMNFVDKISKELSEEVNRVLLENKDGEEVTANGYIRGSTGEYKLKIQGENYLLVVPEKYPDIKQIIPVLANEELLVSIVGIINLSDRNIVVEKVNIVDTPSPKLQREIAKALEGYEEGEAAISGKVKGSGDSLTFTSKDKTYSLSAEAEDLLVFLNTVKNEDQMIEIYGHVSNREKTVKAESATVIGQIPESLRQKLANAMSDYIDLPKSGSKVDAQGMIVNVNDKYYISVAFHNYEIVTSKDDIKRALPILSDTGLMLMITGKIDNDDKTINAEKLVILETPSEEIVEEMDKIIKGDSNSNIKGDKDKDKDDKPSNNNNPFGNFFNNKDGESPFGNFGSLFGDKDGDNPFGNFGNLFGDKDGDSPFGNFGNLFGGKDGESPFGNLFGNGEDGESPFGNLGSLFDSLGGGDLFNSIFGNNDGMPSLSFDQIQQQLSGMGGGSNNSNNDSNQGESSGNDGGGSFGGGSDEDSGFSIGD